VVGGTEIPKDQLDQILGLAKKGLEAQNLFLEEYLNLPKTPEEDGARIDIYVFLK
jgi:hypothetical protein